MVLPTTKGQIMPTPPQYVGRHVKNRNRLGIDSITPRGPERWARAAANALANPLSSGAKLYFDRVATARRFIDYKEAALPFEHVEDEYFGTDFNDLIASSKRKYVTCNIVCAAMQVQLDFGTTDLGDVRAIFRSAYRRSYRWNGGVHYARSQTNVIPLDTTTLTRNVRCQVCATIVRKGGR